MTSFKIQYTLDGESWVDYQDGKVLSGPVDRTTKVRHNLNPFLAITVRLVTVSIYRDGCFRFDATFIDN